MGFEVKLDRRTPWVLSITEEPGQLKYHVDRRTGEDDSWCAVSRDDLEFCRELAARLLSDRRMAGESIDSLRAAIGGRLLPAGLRQELCGAVCVEAGLVIRDDTEWRIPWHILFPHGSMRLDERMYLPEPSRHRPSALFLLDPCSDLLYSMGADAHSVRVRSHMQADLNALLRLFDAAGIPVTVCQGAAVTRRFIADSLGRHDFIYYLGHAREGELLLGGGQTFSVGDLLPLPEGRASCVFINGCRSGGASDDGLGIARAIGRTVNAGCVAAPVYAVGYELAGKAACAFFGQLLANKSAGKAMEEMRRQVGGPGEGYVLFCNYPGMDFAHRGGALQLAKAALPALVAAAGLSMILLRGGEAAPYRLAPALAACLPGALAASFLYYQWGYYRCRQLPAVCLLLISLVLLLPGAATASGAGGHRIVLGAAYVAALLIYAVLICNYRLLVKKERMRP